MGHFRDTLSQPSGAPQITYMRSVPNRGMIRYRGFLNQEYILLTSLETLKEVMHTRPYTFTKPGKSGFGIGRGSKLRSLPFMEGEEHRHQRKLMTPAFSYGQIKALVPMFWERSVQLRDKIEQVISVKEKANCEETVVDIEEWLSHATLDIVCGAGFGYECNAIASAPIAGGKAESGPELAEAYNIIFYPGGGSMAKAFTHLSSLFPLLAYIPFHRIRQVKKAVGVINRVAEKIAKEKAEVAKTSDPGEGKDILTTMLKSGNCPAETKSWIGDQVFTFLVAGNETTTTALTWAIYFLSLPKHRHMQERLRAEIYSRFPGGLPENVTYEEIESLKYLRNVMMEVLRLRSPLPLSARQAAHDTTLAGEFVPKGTRIVLALQAINRSLELWGEDADEFNPDRWEKQVGSNNAFLTFMSGPRGCIGSLFAKAEVKCLLMAMVGSFEFEELKGREVVSGGNVTQRPIGGMPVRVRKVKWGGE